MKKEELLNDDFLKQLQKRGIEKILEGELDNHLESARNSKSASGNTCNGYTSKKVRTSYGESEINVPRDRNSSFNPILVPK